MYKVQCDDALLSLQISRLAGEYEIVTCEELVDQISFYLPFQRNVRRPEVG